MAKEFEGLNTDNFYSPVDDAIDKATTSTKTKRPGKTEVCSISLPPEINDYAEIMSALYKHTKSSFIASLIQKDMDENRAIYEQAKKLQQKL